MPDWTNDNQTPTNAQPPAAAPVQAQPPQQSNDEPSWLADRLERAKRSALADAVKALGVESIDQARAMVEQAKQAEESRKSELQKLAERQAVLEAEAKRAAQLTEVVKQRAEFELAALSAEQRAAVMSLAGDDYAAQLRAVTALRPTWSQSQSQQVQPPAPQSEQQTIPPRPPPASTSAAAPPPVSQTSAPFDHKAEYARIKDINPVLAAAYLQQHMAEIIGR